MKDNELFTPLEKQLMNITDFLYEFNKIESKGLTIKDDEEVSDDNTN